uniref:uncharacterized protein isoform X2 n=1 Tax=Pristiophorus japonicus TaxID=55135 RepID=UPI00398F3BCE
MIDLSHLTEEEQAKIMRVLQRDAELRKVEENRIRHVQESVENVTQRKNMTGEWFYKAKAKRHKDTLHGAELIQASIRKKKPMTIYERLQSKELKEKSKSFMTNAGSNVFVSPELSVFLQESKSEEPQTSTTSRINNRTPKQQKQTPRQTSLSPGKQRENPFNKSFLADDIPNGVERPQLSAGTQSSSVTPTGDRLSHLKDNVSRLHFPSNEFLETKKQSPAENDNHSEMHPVPKPRTISYKLQDSVTYSDHLSTAPGPKNLNGFNGNSTTPKSILKRSPSSSSNDSEVLRISVQDSKNKISASPQTIPEGATELNSLVENEELLAPNSLERSKQVRFSTNVDEMKKSQTLEPYGAKKMSKIGEDHLLDTVYFEEIDEENIGGTDSTEENEIPHKGSGFSDFHHQSSPPLQTGPLYLNEDEVNAMSNSDIQSIPATNSNSTNYTNSHLPSYGSGKVTNQVHEMDTGEILAEKEANGRLNPASNPSHYSVDKQILHTDFESPQVSDQHPAEIFQGKRVNFAVPLFKTAPAEQRPEAHSSQSKMHDKYTTEHMKAADESISKVLDWFTRSEEMPSVNTRLEEMKTPEPRVESKPKAVMVVHAKPDTKFSHIDTDMFTIKTQVSPNISLEIQGQEKQEIQLQNDQTQIKENIFNKSVIPEPIFMEEKNKARKNDFEITYPISQNIVQRSNAKQQHIKLEQVEESEQQGLSILKPFLEKERAGAKENASGEPENTKSTSQDVDFFHIATNKNSAQETKPRPKSTSSNIEESKTLPSIDTKDTTEDIPSTIQKLSPKHTTSYQENSFANAVFGMSTKKDNTIDVKSSNYGSLLLANKGTNPVTTESLCSTFLNNGVMQDLDQTKTKKEQSNDEINQQKINRNEKGQATTRYEKPFLEKERQGPRAIVHTPEYTVQSASTENIAPSKTEIENAPTKQNEQETNTLQWKRIVNVPDLEQTLNKEENKTEGNDTHVIPEKEKPFTIVSIKKRICKISDNPHLNHTQFTNLRNFWDKDTKSNVDDDAQSVLTNTPDDKHLMISKMAARTKPEMLMEAKPSVTQNPILVRRILTVPSSNFETAEEPAENENTETKRSSGPTVQERMQQILQQRPAQTEKKILNTKYFPKVLPTEPGDLKVKFKKATNASNKDKLSPISSDFQKHSSEVEKEAQESTICQPKLKELKTLNIGLQKLLQEKDESESPLVEKQNKYEDVLQPEHQTFMLSDNESIDRRTVNSQTLLEDMNQRDLPSGQNTFNVIRNNEEEDIPEKTGRNVESLHSRTQTILKPTGCFPVIEENFIPQKKLNKFESLDNMIQGILTPTEMSFQEEKVSPIKSDEDSKYDEELGIDMDKDKRGFELQDEFQSGLNLPSGITRSSTFKETDDGPNEKSTEMPKSDVPYNPDPFASPKNVFPNHSEGDDHLYAESWRSSLNEEEEMSPLALKRNSRTSETYKSLEDINAIGSMPNTLDSTNKEITLSADDVSTIPTSLENQSLQSKRMKRLSKSVPAFPENDDADSMSESSYQMDKHGTIASSLTNISSSSGMASRSSVSGSMMSIYSGDFGNIDVRGRIQFSLDYVDKLNEFHIFVVRCSDLAAAEEKKNRSDPYVKSYLLPDKIKMGKRKTSVKKKTLNPVYNEILRYKIEKASLMAQTLNLSVWHNDTFGRNNFLGEVEIELEKWDWSNKKMDWHNLKPRTLSAIRMDENASLKVAFQYIPQAPGGKKTGEVQIWVKEASNLPQIRANRLDPFVKCYILPNTSRKSRQKTRVVKKNRNPTFNHTMVYNGFRTEDLKDACVELSVWDHDKLVNHFLGGMRIGLGTGKSYGVTVDWMDSTEEEASVWDNMITHPNMWIEDVLPLRMLRLSKMSGN